MQIRALGWVGALALIACGSSGDASTNDGSSGAPDGSSTTSGGPNGSSGGPNGSSGNTAETTLLGVWKIDGTDARGAFTGQLELREDAGKTSAIRIVKYTTATVEDGRELWWVWTGTAKASGAGYSVDVALRRAEFVKSRGGVTRTEADKVPAKITGALALGGAGATATWTGDVTQTDSLSGRVDSGTAPIFVTDRVKVPVNAAPTGAEKTGFDTLYASYRSLPNVAPYASDPAFAAGICDVIVDKTDFDFYRAHPHALRVVDKIIDAPSLGETLARADAFGQTLSAKAAMFDARVPAAFVDTAGMLVDSIDASGAKIPTGDGSLWTSAWVASQAYRYLVTKDATALANVETGALGIQRLMEITPDQTAFARTIRPASGNATGQWHAGTGAYAAYDWLEGGNNDMFKGLFYGTLTAYIAMCDPVVSGKDAVCTHLRSGAKHMTTLALAQGTTESNHLIAEWVSAYLNNDLGDLAQVLESWAVLQVSVQNANFTERELATADWSGTHLGFVGFMTMHLLAQKKSLPGFDADATVATGVGKMRDDFQPFRMGLWSLLYAKLAPVNEPKDLENALWRMRELPGPRSRLDVDHRVSADFVMSPYPSLPWKNDWTTTDRTSSLHGYPAFETPQDVYVWRLGPFDYQRNTEPREYPGADYLHAYWLGRYIDAIAATE